MPSYTCSTSTTQTPHITRIIGAIFTILTIIATLSLTPKQGKNTQTRHQIPPKYCQSHQSAVSHVRPNDQVMWMFLYCPSGENSNHGRNTTRRPDKAAIKEEVLISWPNIYCYTYGYICIYVVCCQHGFMSREVYTLNV